MTLRQLGTAKTGNVGEAPLTGVSRVAKRLICLLLALICALWITPFAQAADALGTMTDDITDPQNLLGSNVFAVTDKVKQTKADTGVIVRLLYVDSFGETAKPVEFVTQVLESVNPKPKIAKEKKTDTSSTTAMVGAIGLGVTLVALVAVVVVAVVLHRRKARKGQADPADDEEAVIEESLDADESQTADSQQGEASEPIEQPVDQSGDQSGEEPASAPETEPHESDI